jgi:hypothetical protein
MQKRLTTVICRVNWPQDCFKLISADQGRPVGILRPPDRRPEEKLQ